MFPIDTSFIFLCFPNGISGIPKFSFAKTMFSQDTFISMTEYISGIPWHKISLSLTQDISYSLLIQKFANSKKKILNPFVPNVPFLYPPENIGKAYVFLMFSGVEKGCTGNEWVKTLAEIVATSSLLTWNKRKTLFYIFIATLTNFTCWEPCPKAKLTSQSSGSN